MKIKVFNIVLFLLILSMASCVKNAQQNQEECSRDTIPIDNEFNNLDEDYIKSLIKNDEKRGIYSYNFKKSASSPLFYEAICDDGLYLYRYIQQGDDSSVIILEDNNISYLVDCIGDLTDYEHKGYYEILDDSTVVVIFDEWYRNYCQPDDTIESAHLYHIQCTHSYKLTDMRWKSIKKDTIILKDERSLFCGDEISKYIY